MLRRLVPYLFFPVLMALVLLGITGMSPARAQRTAPPRPKGVFIFYDWRHLDKSQYPITGGHVTVTWRSLQPDRNRYGWQSLDDFLAQDARLGKQDGVGIDPYDGPCCGGLGTPDYLTALDPDAVIACPSGERIPNYANATYMAEYGKFIVALGARFNGDPRIAFLEIGVGMFGETQPARDAENDCLQAAGLTQDKWLLYSQWTIDRYAEAFPDTALVLEYAPRYVSACERRILTDYAAARGVGLQHSGLRPDADTSYMDEQAGPMAGCGQYDPLRKWQGQVVLGWEGTEGNHAAGPTATMWRIYNALDKHPDFILLDYAQVTDPVRHNYLRFADAYLGRTPADTPDVWVALRETEYTWYAQRGNYEFWLHQNDEAPGGRTIPLWNTGPEPQGRYTRRTDEATGNASMYFDVADSYVLDGTNTVRIIVTYLDRGRDTWELQYDGAASEFTQAAVITKTDTGTWQQAVFDVADARFANRQPGGGAHRGSDFRIWSRDDGDETIHFVQVKVLTHSPLPDTPTARPTDDSILELDASPVETVTPTPTSWREAPTGTPEAKQTAQAGQPTTLPPVAGAATPSPP